MFPIYIRIKCDEDGWILFVNDDPEYPSYFHGISPFQIETVKVKGDSKISYIGFGPKGNNKLLNVKT